MIPSSVVHRLWSSLIAPIIVALPAAAQNRGPDLARALTLNLGLQARVMWVDGTANIDRIKTIEGVRDIVAKCKAARFNMIVVDVKPVVGQVLYDSKVAEHLVQWKGKTYPEFDTLKAFVEEGHKAGIEIAASFNVFAEGHKYFNTGLAYRNREWQSVAYNVDRSLIAPDGAKLAVRAPSEPEEPGKTLVYGDEFVVDRAKTAGKQIAVSLDSDSSVAGIIDPALLGDEPLVAPEDGRLLLLKDSEGDWVAAHLRAGSKTRFTASGRRVPVQDAATEKVAAFVNPLNPAARAHEMALLGEVARNYKVDAMVFDRMRYANLYNDYGDLSRKMFAEWLQRPVQRWPEDVISYDSLPGEPLGRGPLFKSWLEFRSRVIRDFLRDAVEELRGIEPSLQFGVYVGSWYADYFGVGVNWGSEKFKVTYGWASPSYEESGYAEFLDWVSTGCYYPIPTREDARRLHREEGATVEASADLSVAAVQSAAAGYAGVYALDYDKRPEEFLRAISTAAHHSQGVMVFDISYIYDYDWWKYLNQAFTKDAVPPHRFPDFTSQLRAAQDAAR